MDAHGKSREEVIDKEDSDRELLEEAKEGIMQQRDGHQEG